MARLALNATRALRWVAISETGGAYNSGQHGVTDTYASGFWWLDMLGATPRNGHSLVCRQALVGGRHVAFTLALPLTLTLALALALTLTLTLP